MQHRYILLQESPPPLAYSGVGQAQLTRHLLVRLSGCTQKTIRTEASLNQVEGRDESVNHDFSLNLETKETLYSAVVRQN